MRRFGGSAWWVGLQANVVIMTPARQEGLHHREHVGAHGVVGGYDPDPRAARVGALRLRDSGTDRNGSLAGGVAAGGGEGLRGGYRLRCSNPAPSAAATSLRSNAAKATGAGVTLSRSQRAEAR